MSVPLSRSEAEAIAYKLVADRLGTAIERSGLRVMWCDYCDQVCLAAKRSLCCGESVSNNPLSQQADAP